MRLAPSRFLDGWSRAVSQDSFRVPCPLSRDASLLALAQQLGTHLEGLDLVTAKMFAPLQTSNPAWMAAMFQVSFFANRLAVCTWALAKNDPAQWPETLSTAALKWCSEESLQVGLVSFNSLRPGQCLVTPEGPWTGVICMNTRKGSNHARGLSVCRGLGWWLASQVYDDEDERGQLADLFSAVTLGTLYHLMSDQLRPSTEVLAAEEILRQSRGAA